MFSARCNYVISPKKSSYEATDYIIAAFETSANNVPVKYRNGKRMVSFTAKGKGLLVNKKFNTMLEGKWNFNEKYNNLEFYVEHSDIALPSDGEGIKLYLSTFLKGCGLRTAEKIYNKFGQATLLVLQSEPSKFLEVPGLRKKQLERMLSSYESTQHLQELALMLSPYGLSKNKIELIANAWGKDAVSRIKNEPFCLRKFRGFSFEVLDTMSQKYNCNPNSTERIKAALLHSLKLAQLGNGIFRNAILRSGGHLYVNQYILRETALYILNSRSDSKVELSAINNVIWDMYNNHELLGENGNVYLPINYMQEQKLAKYIVEMLTESRCKRYSDESCDRVMSKAEKDFNIELSTNQKNAVKMVLQNPLSVISGGAGTGKTTVEKVILSSLKQLGETTDNVMLAAPTGKAAIRMTEQTSYSASTIHRALGLINEDDFYKDETEIETLDATTIICDEFSMADNFLAYRLFAAADRRNARIILVGDAGQLPSVGPGKVLKDIMDSGVVPVTVLNVIFRQAQESNIVRNSHNIYDGIHHIVFEKDFELTEANDTEAIAELVVNQYVKEVEKYGIEDTVVLSPIKNKGSYCTNALNERIQKTINPLCGCMVEKKLHGILFREGDKIIQLKNREANSVNGGTVDICNGDTGYIKSITKDTDGFMFRVEFTDNRAVIFDEDDMKNVNLAYAITVHKSQGSEYKSVIMPLHMYMPQAMITRNLLYTGITRAKTQLNIIGQKQCIYQAINNNTAYDRNTGLAQKIIKYYKSEMEVA